MLLNYEKMYRKPKNDNTEVIFRYLKLESIVLIPKTWLTKTY